ncbi:unnamed protein product, partial [Sphacelaria rigidula]
MFHLHSRRRRLDKTGDGLSFDEDDEGGGFSEHSNNGGDEEPGHGSGGDWSSSPGDHCGGYRDNFGRSSSGAGNRARFGGPMSVDMGGDTDEDEDDDVQEEEDDQEEE